MEIEEKTLLDTQLDELLQKEKLARQNNEHLQSAQILKQIVQMLYDAREFDKLFHWIQTLSKKRGQPKKALIDMVQLGMGLINEIHDIALKLRLIETLKDVCDKKIFLEVEYARCCLLVVKNKEDENNINEAAKILQEVQVETYGSMDKREKIEFILYQMRIMIKKEDFVRLYIISKKINRKGIDEAGLEDLKVLFYSYLVRYYVHEGKFLETAECYKQIFETLNKGEEVRGRIPARLEFDFNCEYNNVLENYVMFLVIAPYSKDQVQYLNDLNLTHGRIVEKHAALKNVIEMIMSTELISTDVTTYSLISLELFSPRVENHASHLLNFRKQLIQHNLRIFEKYYDRVHLSRISGLMAIDQDLAEAELCEMINSKVVVAKIDRIQGVVSFRHKKNENEVMNEWVYDVGKLLDVIDKTCNLINRESINEA